MVRGFDRRLRSERERRRAPRLAPPLNRRTCACRLLGQNRIGRMRWQFPRATNRGRRKTLGDPSRRRPAGTGGGRARTNPPLASEGQMRAPPTSRPRPSQLSTRPHCRPGEERPGGTSKGSSNALAKESRRRRMASRTGARFPGRFVRAPHPASSENEPNTKGRLARVRREPHSGSGWKGRRR